MYFRHRVRAHSCCCADLWNVFLFTMPPRQFAVSALRLEFHWIPANLPEQWTQPSRTPAQTHPRTLSVTIFQKIINREIPASIVYEDDLCLAFRDVNPQAPVHVLLIPRKPIASLDDLTSADAELAGHLLQTVPKVAALLGLSGGYRTVVNTGDHGGQSVFHLHIHILGGRSLGWPPG